MSFIGVIFALAMMLGGNMIEGGHPSALIDIPAFMIVIGGSVGAALTQFPFSAVAGVGKHFKWLLFPLRTDFEAQLELLEKMASDARRNGFLALEGMLDDIKDPFTQKGVQLIVDGFSEKDLTHVLEQDMEMEYEEIELTAKFYEAMGGYSPTMGIVGAVFGLIHAMGLLDQPDKLGGAIAVAFVATIYGVGFANLIFLPFGNRYKLFAHQLKSYREMTLTGLRCIIEGSSPQFLNITLSSYIQAHGNGKKEKA